MSDDIPVFPVSGWELKNVPSRGVLLVRLSFLSHPFQKLEEADPGRHYAFQLAQVIELRDALNRAIHTMKTSGGPKPEDPPH